MVTINTEFRTKEEYATVPSDEDEQYYVVLFLDKAKNIYNYVMSVAFHPLQLLTYTITSKADKSIGFAATRLGIAKDFELNKETFDTLHREIKALNKSLAKSNK